VNRNPEHMTNDEVTSEIASLQDEIQVRAFRVHELGSSLYRRVRRNPVDDSTAVYMTYANAMTRFASAVNQVSSRTVRTAKVLNRLPQSPPAGETRPEKPVPTPPAPSPMESLINSYVEESLAEAMPEREEVPQSDED
jgi:hypothetical protein